MELLFLNLAVLAVSALAVRRSRADLGDPHRRL